MSQNLTQQYEGESVTTPRKKHLKIRIKEKDCKIVSEIEMIALKQEAVAKILYSYLTTKQPSQKHL